MNFASVRLITADVDRLTSFYESVTGRPARRHTPAFAEIALPGATLAIGSTATVPVQLVGAGSAIVEFRVDDVDAEFARLRTAGALGEIVQEPTTMPWGNRSLLIRDPDGTLVNLFTPVSATR